MSLAVSDIRSRVRQITRRSNTTDLTNDELDVAILEACREISKRTLCLEGDSSNTLSGSGYTITIPTDMVPSSSAIDEFYLNSSLLSPLTFAEWRAGKQKGFAYRDGTIYITPTEDNDRSYTLYYRKMHGALSTNLEFDDDLKMAVVWRTAQKIYDDYELFDKALTAAQKVEAEVAINAPVEPVICRMRSTRE